MLNRSLTAEARAAALAMRNRCESYLRHMANESFDIAADIRATERNSKLAEKMDLRADEFNMIADEISTFEVDWPS